MINYIHRSAGDILDVFPVGFTLYFTSGDRIVDIHSTVYMHAPTYWELLI